MTPTQKGNKGKRVHKVLIRELVGLAPVKRQAFTHPASTGMRTFVMLSQAITDTRTRVGIDFIDHYTDWASQRSPLTPEHFHQNIALTLACAAIARRSFVQLQHDKVFPNLYTLLIATSSVYAKSTALKIGRELARAVIPEKVLTSVSTPEAMMNELAGNKPANLDALTPDAQKEWTAGAKWGARRLFMIDEAGRLFNAMTRDYNATLDTILMELYDSPDEPIIRTTNKQGLIRVENASLSCLFATTPANIRTVLSNSDSWQSGFWNRWNFVTADQPLVWKESTGSPIPTTVLEPLRYMNAQLNTKVRNVSIQVKASRSFIDFSRETREEIIAQQDERLLGVYSRLPVKRMKAALCFATMENPTKPEITLKHWQATELFSVGWVRDAILALKLCAKTEKANLAERVWSIIVQHREQGISSRRIQQLLDKSADEINPMLAQWEKAGTVRKHQITRKVLWKPNE